MARNDRFNYILLPQIEIELTSRKSFNCMMLKTQLFNV